MGCTLDTQGQRVAEQRECSQMCLGGIDRIAVAPTHPADRVWTVAVACFVRSPRVLSSSAIHQPVLLCCELSYAWSTRASRSNCQCDLRAVLSGKPSRVFCTFHNTTPAPTLYPTMPHKGGCVLCTAQGPSLLCASVMQMQSCHTHKRHWG